MAPRFSLFLTLLLLSSVCASPSSVNSSFSTPGVDHEKVDPPSDVPSSHGSNDDVGVNFSANPWIAAHKISDASRSPCPLLNTLANHGFLPRNGRNLSMSDFNKALIEALNLHPDFANLITATNFELLGLIPDINSTTSTTIDLVTLNNHTTGNEHDASLTRLDHIQLRKSYVGDSANGNVVVNKNLLEQVLGDSIPGSYPFLNTSSLGRSRARREAESLAAGSPALSDLARTASLNEAGLLIQFIGEGGDPNVIGGGEEVWDQRLAEKDDVYEWLAFERFPSVWKRTKTPITADRDMLPLARRVAHWQAYWSQQDEGETSGN